MYATADGPLPDGEAARRLLARDGWCAFAVSTTARAAASLLLGLLVWSQVPVLLGWETTVVMSGSMSPAIPAGDVAVVRPVDEDRSSIGQVLLVDDPDHPGALRLHRLVAVEEGGLRLQGDANASADTSLVPPSAVHGVGVLRIPVIGLPVVWATQQQWGPLAGAGGLLALVLTAATWHRTSESGAGADREAVRVSLPSRWRSLRSRGQHAAPTTRRTVWLRRVGTVTVLAAVCPLVFQQARPASAAYTAVTVNAADSVAMDRVISWGCVDETSVPASRFYALRETAGTTAYNTGASVATAASKGNGTYRGGVVPNPAGPDCGNGVTGAVTLDGSTGWISTAGSQVAPDDFTTQVWFRTTVPGGRLFGLNSQEVYSGQYDRHVYLTNSGQLTFGTYSGGYHTATSPAGKNYADGVWHLVTATLGTAGMRLFVDGTEVAANPTQTVGEPFTGYWRFGWGDLTNWPSAPTNHFFTGSLASAAVWNRALLPTEVAAQFRPTR